MLRFALILGISVPVCLLSDVTAIPQDNSTLSTVSYPSSTQATSTTQETTNITSITTTTVTTPTVETSTTKTVVTIASSPQTIENNDNYFETDIVNNIETRRSSLEETDNDFARTIHRELFSMSFQQPGNGKGNTYSRLVPDTEVIWPENMEYENDALMCFEEYQLHHVWSTTGTLGCLICTCMNINGHLHPKCATCGLCAPRSSPPEIQLSKYFMDSE